MGNYTLDQVELAYIAFFGRPGEPTGVDYWMNNSSVLQLSDLYNEFSQSPEYGNLYSAYVTKVPGSNSYSIKPGSEKAIITQAYQNLFGHAPDTAGLNYWANDIAQGWITFSNLLLQLEGGALGADAVAITAKLLAVNAFTTALGARQGYQGTAALNEARVWLSGITDLAKEAAAVVPAVLDAEVVKIINLDTIIVGISHTLTAGQDVLYIGANDVVYGSSTTLTPGDKIIGTGSGVVNLDFSTGTTGLFDGEQIRGVSNVVVTTHGTTSINTSQWSNIGGHTLITNNSTGTVNYIDLQQTTNDWDTSTSSFGNDYAINDFVDATGLYHLNFDIQAVDTANTLVDLTVNEVTANILLDSASGQKIENLNLHIADLIGHESTISSLHVQGINQLNIDGGLVGRNFAITAALDPTLTVIDANAALANLSLNVSDPTRNALTVTLGHGNDTLITGDTLGGLGDQDTIHGGDGADTLTAVFTSVGTRNPISDGVETYNLTFNNSASVDFLQVYDLTTIDVAPSTSSAKLFDIHPSVHNINVTGSQTGLWQIDFQPGSAGGVNGIPEPALGDLTLNWTDNSNASSTLDQLGGFVDVQKLTFVKDGFQDDFVNNFSVDAALTQKLQFSVIGDGLLDVEGVSTPVPVPVPAGFGATVRVIDAAAVRDLSFLTNANGNNSNGDLYVAFANEGANYGLGVIDTHSIRTLDIEANNRGNIGVGNLLYGKTLQTVNIHSAGANVDLFSIQGADIAEYLAHPGGAVPTADLGSTVTSFDVGSTSSSAVTNHIAIGRIVAEDIHVFNAHAALHTTINLSAITIDNHLDPSLDGGTVDTPVTDAGIWLTNHGDTFTGFGPGEILPITFGAEAFTTFDFHALSNAHSITGLATNPAWVTAPAINGGFNTASYGIAVNFEAAHNDVTFTGTSHNDLVIAGLGNNNINTGAGNDYVLINPASTGNNVISTGAGIDTVELSTAAPGTHGRDFVTEPGTNVNSVINGAPVTDGTIDTIVNFNQLTDTISFGPNGGVAGTSDLVGGNTHLATAAVLDYAAALVAADTHFIANTHLVYDFEYVSATEGFLFQHNTIVPATETVIHLVGLNTANPFGAANIVA